MRRKWANASLSGIAVISFLGSIAIGILDWIGRVDTARNLYDSLAAGGIAGVTINWSAVYFYLFVFSIMALVAVNWVAMGRTVNRWKANKRREWDITAKEAIEYIAEGSWFSESLPYGHRFSVAFQAFKERYEAGKIVVVGRPDGKATPERIPRSVRKNTGRLKYNLVGHDSWNQKVGDVMIVSTKDPEKTLYRGLMVDRHELARNWPPKPSRF